MARELGTEKLLERRSFLKLAGATAASVAGVGAGATAAAGQTDGGVLLNEDFSDSDYQQSFTSSYILGEYDDSVAGAARDGSSGLKVSLPEGSHYGMHSTYDPVEAGDADSGVKEMYNAFWVRFSPDFDTISSNGKLPGLANMPNGPHAGERSDGTNGWHAGGRYENATDSTIDIGYYAYYMDQPTRWGHGMAPATVPKGEWVHVEQYVKLNTVSGGSANPDGELKLWVDGELELDRADMRYTLEPERGINVLWNIYHGGNDPAPHDQAVSFDGWKVSTERIGLPSDSGGGSSGDGSDDETTTGDGDGTVLELDSAQGTENLNYEFTVDGSVSKRTSAGDMSAESNDEVTDNGDGTVTVSGVGGNGYGDSFLVNGSVTSMTIDESNWTIRYGGKEVSVDELTGSASSQLPNRLVVDGSNRPGVASTYTFEVSGEVEKDAESGTVNKYDTVSDGTVSGRIIGGKDGYRFSGEITGFSLDGPAQVRIEDGS